MPSPPESAPRDARRLPDVSEWPDRARATWQRIQAHVFDHPGDALPLSKRLARDNHWSDEFAGRVLEEYRRFTLLATVTEHPVTPSDQVDQAWHLHLLYTRDYWQLYCPEVLRFELHHGPTRGGAEQGSTFDEQYSQTRHSYLQWFGHHPPADIWPPSEIRFGRDVRWVRINLDDYELRSRKTADASTRPRSWLRPLFRRVSKALSVGALPVLLAAASAAPTP